MRTYHLAVLLSTAAVLTGCGTSYYWVNPQGGNYAMDQAACEVESLQTVPPAIETTQVSSPEDASTRTICKTGRDGKSSCTTITGAAPLKSVPVDMNEGTRKKAVELCVYRKGWRQISAEEYDRTHATPSVAQHSVDAFSDVLRRAENGDAASQIDVAYRYELGQGVQKDLSSAFYWYEKAAEQGDLNGQMKVGYYYQAGVGVQVDYAQAFKWNQLAANRGDPRAQNNLGMMYVNGDGTEKFLSEAARLFKSSADKGNALGQLHLGDLYQRGWGVDRDVDQAVYWYRKAAAQGNQDAKNALDKVGK